MNRMIAVSALLSASLCALEHSPWMYSPLEFHVGADVYASFFSDVNNGFNPLGYHSTNIGALAHIVAPVLPSWDAELELELEETSKNAFGFESAALQVRHQFLDDVEGDPVSFALLGNIRVVPKQRLRDVATPYHNLGNFELGFSLGKERARPTGWYFRTYLFGALGQANFGYPWVNFLYKMEGKLFNRFVLEGLVRGYFGLGTHTLINVRHFNSYALFNHQNIDVGVSFHYLFKIWGKLSVQYIRRVYVRSFPENYNAVKISYDLPFSF